MAKFAASILDKPFTLFFTRVLDDLTLIIEVSSPKLDFRNFIDSLSILAKMKLIKDYTYYIQDLRPAFVSRQTIVYKLFENKTWNYEHEKYIAHLRELAEKVHALEISDN